MHRIKHSFLQLRHIVQTYRQTWKQKHAFGIILVFWALSAIVNLPYFNSQEVRPLFLDPNKTFRCCGEFCGEYLWASKTTRKVYGTVMLDVQFVIPVIILTFSYSEILRKVRREMIVAQIKALSGKQLLDAAKRKRRVIYILILMVAAFVLSWLPLSLVNILRDFDVRLGFVDDQMYFYQLIIHSIAMTSVIWNPILYFWMSESNRGNAKRNFLAATRTRSHAASNMVTQVRRTRTGCATCIFLTLHI